MSSKQETPKEEFQKDIPQNLLSNLKNAKTKHQKEIANAEIKRKEFTKIRFVGQVFKHYNLSNDTGKLVVAHWRRGFWRNQTHGQGLKKHKLIWIKPTIVNVEKGDPTSGHIYQA